MARITGSIAAVGLDYDGNVLQLRDGGDNNIGAVPRVVQQGTFVANGATPVSVTAAGILKTDCIEVSLNTVGGTVSPTRPNIMTITAGSGFTVAGVASDTSTYNYRITRSQ